MSVFFTIVLSYSSTRGLEKLTSKKCGQLFDFFVICKWRKARKERRQGREEGEGKRREGEGGQRRAEAIQGEIMSERERSACLERNRTPPAAEMYVPPGLFTDRVLESNKREDFKRVLRIAVPS